MMVGMIKENIGFNDIENFFSKNNEMLRGGSKGERQKGKVVREMLDRKKDNEKDKIEWRRRKGFCQTEIGGSLGQGVQGVQEIHPPGEGQDD